MPNSSAADAAREIIALHEKGRLVVGGRLAVKVAEAYLASVGGCTDGNACNLSNAECHWPECRRSPVYEAPRYHSVPIRVRGVGRVADEPRALLIAMTERPTDDEIKSLHDFIRDWRHPTGSGHGW